MRQTRRGCFAGRKGPKYVWYVYDLSWALDEASATTGSASLNNSSLRMTSGQYTVDASGFTLVNPLYQKPSQMASKVYVVDISSQGSTDTTGPYLYEVTRTDGWNPTYQYVRYSSAPVRGGTVLWVVESDTMDYPIDGEQSGYWYVMVKGEYLMYAWNKYNAVGQYKQDISTNQKVEKGNNETVTVYQCGKIASKFDDGATFDSNTGLYTLKNGYQEYKYVGSFMDYYDKGGRFYGAWMFNATSGTTAYSGSNGWSKNNVTGVTVYTSEFTYTKTDYVGTAESYEQTAYPQDGVQGEYWYTYSHSYSYEFDNR